MKIQFTPVGVSFDDVPNNIKLLSVGSKLQFLHVPAFYGTGERRKEYPNAIAIMFGDKKVGALAESPEAESPQQSILRLIKEGKPPDGTVIELMVPSETQTFKSTYKVEVEVPESKPVSISGTFVEMDTFTGEKILYNEASHQYKDLDGNALVSGSQYKKSLEKPFPLDLMAGKVATKHGISPQTVSDMWEANGLISRTFGTALHLAMEQWFKYRDSSCEDKEYNLAKHPFLRTAVQSFPLKDDNCLPEVLISDVKNKRVGRIDLLTITGENEGYIEDYKSDADIDKNLAGHFNQLSFYAKILIEKGWDIKGVRVWNYTDKWNQFESEVLEIK